MFLLLGATLSIGAMAQATPSQTVPTKAAAVKAVKKDVKELEQQRKQRNKKIVKAQFGQAKDVQKDINADRKHLKANKKHLKNKGVKMPIEKAKEGSL